MVYLLYIVHVYVYTYVIFAEIQILQIISYTKKKVVYGQYLHMPFECNNYLLLHTY